MHFRIPTCNLYTNPREVISEWCLFFQIQASTYLLTFVNSSNSNNAPRLTLNLLMLVWNDEGYFPRFRN